MTGAGWLLLHAKGKNKLMRMRTKKNLDIRLEKCLDIRVSDFAGVKGRWQEHFGNDGLIYLEIGCGKGTFVCEMARRNPDINFIAMEKDKNVIISAMEKVKEEKLDNIRFICENADILEDILAENECDRIFLNFSDPLPKQGYRKRRLTHERYLKVYSKILKPNCEIHQKTDNKGLFEFSLESFLEFGFDLKNVSLDLHSENHDWNIITEYEQRFSDMGCPIYRLEAVNRSVI